MEYGCGAARSLAESFLTLRDVAEGRLSSVCNNRAAT
jgi:hypothetical protein